LNPWNTFLSVFFSADFGILGFCFGHRLDSSNGLWEDNDEEEE